MSYAFQEYSATSVGIPLLRPSLLARVVESVVGSRVTFSGANVASVSRPAGTESYYLLITF